MTQRRIIELGSDRKLNTQVDGPEGAPWVVFSNSVMTDLSIWDGQVAALADRFRLLRYDQRGHGRSTVTNGPLRFEDYGADLRDLLTEFDIERCTFVGLSMGVPTGLAAFADIHESLDAFVAVDGVSRSAAGRAAFWSEKRDTALSQGMETIAADTVLRWLPGATSNDPEAILLGQMILGTPAEGFAAATHALQSYDHSSVVSRLACPVLGIAGALDGAMPEAVRTQFSLAKNARFTDVTGAGHIPNFQAPRVFNACLLDFLSAVYSNTFKEPI